MNKNEVIERLCQLVSDVGEKVFENEHPHDCFCGKNPHMHEAYFNCAEVIIKFIEDAVQEKMQKN